MIFGVIVSHCKDNCYWTYPTQNTAKSAPQLQNVCFPSILDKKKPLQKGMVFSLLRVVLFIATTVTAVEFINTTCSIHELYDTCKERM